jgi:hypothetical protein
MNRYKIKLYEYFDGLINRLDLAVETAILENLHDESITNELNKQRDAFLEEIRDVQAFGLKAISDLSTEPGKELTNKELFPKFCFLIQISDDQEIYTHEKLVELELGLKLIVTDTYLTEGQIKCYENFLNFICHQFCVDSDMELFIEKDEYCVIFFAP